MNMPGDMNEDELERLMRGGATGADRPLADVLARIRQGPARPAVPSSWLTAVLDGVAVGEEPGHPTPPLPAPRPPRRPRWGRLALAPALKGVLAGAFAAGAVAASVVAVHAVSRDERLPVRVISPASSSAPAPMSTNQSTPQSGAGRPGSDTGVRSATGAATGSHAGHEPLTGTQDAHRQPAPGASAAEPSSTESSNSESSSTESSNSESSNSESSSTEPSSTEPSSSEPSTAQPPVSEQSSQTSPQASAPDGASQE